MRFKIPEGGSIPKEIMDLLKEIAEHRDICDQCMSAMKDGTGRYCPTGSGLVIELSKQEGVDFEK